MRSILATGLGRLLFGWLNPAPKPDPELDYLDRRFRGFCRRARFRRAWFERAERRRRRRLQRRARDAAYRRRRAALP